MSPRADRDEILGRYPFPIDRFQLAAIDALDDGRHVIVAAPTGSGKTVVAEYAVAYALRDGGRAFYTAPIKALANQKYRDLCDIHGDDNVGLLTGDNAINGDAPVVVMTTEVLRNMIYARRDLNDLTVVVLDEVHFLQDAYRGPVWEEVIIHLPLHVRLVCLSATVSNAAELADWVETVRGPTTSVVEEQRPVALDNWYFVADRTNDRLSFLPTLVDGRPNPQAIKLDASAARFRPGRRNSRDMKGSGTRKLATPGRVEAIRTLEEQGLLPCIYFIFSRNQCDEAARTLVASGFRFHDDAANLARVHDIVNRRLDGLLSEDLDVLGYRQFLANLEAGVAAHHAGMIPPFKEIVERCFIEGLIKVVFATETLAVGVNMPARSVVIEKLTKYTGERHETLAPSQFTQLTGRAGRRGIDDQGSAVVMWSPFVRFDQVAELALSRSFQLRSVFRPTYNMAANLVRTYDAATARQLLALSFAQFQADRDVVRIERRLQRQREQYRELSAAATSPFGDIDEYRGAALATGPHVRDDPRDLALMELRPGAVIHVSKGKLQGPVAVVATAHRKGGFRVTAISTGADVLHFSADDFTAVPKQIGSVVLPGTYSPNRHDYRGEVAKRLRRAKLSPNATGKKQSRAPVAEPGTGFHPVEADPDLRDRLKAAEQADRVRVEIAELERRVQHRNSTLVNEFDHVLAVLTERGALGDDGWSLTRSGEMLARMFHECDLLIVEALRLGLFDGLDAPTIAGLASTFIYEHRSPDDPPAPWFPNSDARARWRDVERLSTELGRLERSHGLSEHRAPDPTFFAIAYAWAAGEGFAEVVADDDLTGGDFVRTVKQLIDLLGQIGNIAPLESTRSTARSAADAAFRGVVADSSAVDSV
ncbi:MAG TPA: DEAD/DEAH box helicase [Ilumatobacter sp.]|nr:DEAD/DEAH box helicase [Ilumatobacter sp.]